MCIQISHCHLTPPLLSPSSLVPSLFFLFIPPLFPSLPYPSAECWALSVNLGLWELCSPRLCWSHRLLPPASQLLPPSCFLLPASQDLSVQAPLSRPTTTTIWIEQVLVHCQPGHVCAPGWSQPTFNLAPTLMCSPSSCSCHLQPSDPHTPISLSLSLSLSSSTSSACPNSPTPSWIISLPTLFTIPISTLGHRWSGYVCALGD